MLGCGPTSLHEPTLPKLIDGAGESRSFAALRMTILGGRVVECGTVRQFENPVWTSSTGYCRTAASFPLAIASEMRSKS